MATALSAVLGRGVLKVVDYTTSGTFLPSDYDLIEGDVVWLRMVGGGAGGDGTTSSPFSAVGGAAGEYLDMVPYTITNPDVPIPVTIGAGGAVGAGGAGGSSSFGSVVAAGGPAPTAISSAAIGGRGAGGPGMMWASAGAINMLGGPGVNGFARGGAVNVPPAVYTPRQNSGDGGVGSASSSIARTVGAAGRVQIFLGV